MNDHPKPVSEVSGKFGWFCRKNAITGLIFVGSWEEAPRAGIDNRDASNKMGSSTCLR